MEIIIEKLFDRRLDVNEIQSCASVVDITDVLDDYQFNFLKSLNIAKDNEVKAVERVSDKVVEVYCFFMYKILPGEDGETKAFVIEKIIIDNKVISEDFFKWVFEVVFNQKYGFYDRMIIGKMNIRLEYNIEKNIKDVSSYLYNISNANPKDKLITIKDFSLELGTSD